MARLIDRTGEIIPARKSRRRVASAVLWLGGSGKARLAVEARTGWAEDPTSAGHFSDGIWWGRPRPSLSRRLCRRRLRLRPGYPPSKRPTR
jgi:hypothetical protein